MPAEYRARIEAARPRLIAMARDQYGLDIDSGPFGISSRMALIGAKVAEHAGKGPEYHARVMRAYWQDAMDISDRSTLVALAVESGLAREAFEEGLDAAEFASQVQADVDQAYAYGLQGVPAMVFNDRYLISGAQPLAVLRRAVEQLQSAAD